MDPVHEGGVVEERRHLSPLPAARFGGGPFGATVYDALATDTLGTSTSSIRRNGHFAVAYKASFVVNRAAHAGTPVRDEPRT